MVIGGIWAANQGCRRRPLTLFAGFTVLSPGSGRGGLGVQLTLGRQISAEADDEVDGFGDVGKTGAEVDDAGAQGEAPVDGGV